MGAVANLSTGNPLFPHRSFRDIAPIHTGRRQIGQNAPETLEKDPRRDFPLALVGGSGKKNLSSLSEWNEIPVTPFYGNYDVSIDDKNRMLIPADIRRTIDPATDGAAFFMLRGVNQKPWLYPEKHYFDLASQLRSVLAPEEDILAFDRWHFGTAARLEWDKQGRILIPEKMIRKAGLTKEVTVIGMRDHVEIWNRADWAAQEDELDRRQSEIALLIRRKQEMENRPATA